VQVNPGLARGYEALSRHDYDGFLEGLHEDAELHELAEMPDTAVYRGHDEIRSWAEEGASLVADWAWIPEEVLHIADGVTVIRVRFSGRGAESGAPLEQALFHVIDFRDVKATRIRGYLSADQALAAAGAPG
jgi:ketosteroid isomerase-like protein